ncbi:MAG: hypothetical protein Q9213_005996 [Squamulea squamosa]
MPSTHRSGEVTVRRSSTSASGQGSSSGSRHHGSGSNMERSERGSRRPLALPAIDESTVSSHRGDNTGYHSRAMVRRDRSSGERSSVSEMSTQLGSLTLAGSSNQTKDSAHQRTSTAVQPSSRSSHARHSEHSSRYDTSTRGESSRSHRSTHRDYSSASTYADTSTRDEDSTIIYPYPSRHSSSRTDDSTVRPYRRSSRLSTISSSDEDYDLDLDDTDIYGDLTTHYGTLSRWDSRPNRSSSHSSYVDYFDAEFDAEVSRIESHFSAYKRGYRAAMADARPRRGNASSLDDKVLRGLTWETIERYANHWAVECGADKPRKYEQIKLYAGIWACELKLREIRDERRSSRSSSRRY